MYLYLNVSLINEVNKLKHIKKYSFFYVYINNMYSKKGFSIYKKLIMTAKKYYTGEQIMKKYDNLTLKRKNNTLYDALDYMQQYDGRSIILCIAMALGYDNYEGENTTYFKRTN